MPLAIWLIGVGFALLVTGCSEPAGVGLDLVDESGLEPARLQIAPTDVESKRFEKVTGAVRGAAAFSGAVSSFLAGAVDDPLLGSKTVVGYVDFRSDNLPDSFAEDSVTFAELILERQYVYGDTSGVHTFIIQEMQAAWDPTDKTSLSDFESGEPIAAATFAHTDTVLSIRLPESWVTSHQELLKNDDFEEVFHGFRLSADDARVVLGFGATSSFLRLGSTADTVDLVVERVFTGIHEEASVPLPPDRLAIVDGTGDGVTIAFDFDALGSSNGVVNRAVLRIPIDTLALATEVGETFVRPELLQLNLYGERDGDRDLLGTTIRSSSGEFSFVGLSVASEDTFLRSVQAALLGKPTYTSYVLLPSPSSNTLNSALLRVGGGSGPVATLTLLPN